mmetsp:Transcript_1496/g.4434  ORF Transcript_1496/g.4434 Transcript_1496/m.4434 type:complete len:340 (+) Transcript_1496:1230-2249(+)
MLSSSRPLPSLNFSTSSFTAAQKASYTPLCTKVRLAQMQVCPQLRNALPTTPFAASATSASLNTMNGALPPSSRLIFFTVSAACFARILPTAVDPVKPTLRTTSLFITSAVISLELPVRTDSTPLGTPARTASSASARAVSGVWLAGFSSSGQPAARAGEALRVIMDMGKFQGVTAYTTPMGLLITTNRLVDDGAWSTSPSTRLASSANHSMDPAPPVASTLDSLRGFPLSAVMMMATSSKLSITSWYHFFKMSARCLAVCPFQPANALSAAAIAFAVSPPRQLGTVAITSCVDGLMTSTVSPSAESDHSPPISAWVLNSSGSFMSFLMASMAAVDCAA